MQFGGHHLPAPELRVTHWIDAKGAPLDRPLRLADLGAGYKILYCFQHWCPGCHSRGFAVIQTVFEGAQENTADKLRLNQEHYGLHMPFGHDLPPEGERYPTFMEDYRSGGTPWFTVIDPEGRVVHADFRLDAARLLGALDAETLDFDEACHTTTGSARDDLA